MPVRTISTKLAVEGEAQYRQSIANSNRELQTMKSSLALLESEFRNNANSMAALTAKGDALSKLFEAQKNKVSELENALKNCQEAQKVYSDRADTARENVSRYEKALEDLKNSTGDTSKEQAELTAELERWQEELDEAEAGEAAATQGVQNWEKQLNTAKIELNNLDDQIQQSGKYLDEAKQSTDGCATSIDQYGKEVKEAAEKSEDFGDKSKEAINQLAAAMAAAGIAGTVKEITAALQECADASASFETAMAKVSTLADTSVMSMDELKSGIAALSSETGASVENLAEAMYQALSAGVDTANAVDFVSTATKLSTAGFTDSATAVDVLTTALNAYGMESSEVERVASVLVKTQDLGKTSVGELASSMGRVIPVAAAYNVSLEDLSSAYAILTANGTDTRIATTNLSAMFNELASDSSEVAKVIRDQTGKSFSDLMGEGKNLGDVISILGDSVNNDATAFSNLWSSSTAGQSALSLLNSGTEKFNATLEEMQGSAGAVQRNFEIMADTSEFTQKRVTTAAQNLKIAIGDKLNPALNEMRDIGANALNWATDFVNENPWIVGAIGGVTTALGALSIGVGALAAAPAIIGALNTALALLEANPVVLALTAVTGLAVAIGMWASASEDATLKVEDLTVSAREMEAVIGEAKVSAEEATTATAATADVALRYINRLKELNAIEELNDEQKKEYSNTVALLTQLMPELADSIELTTDGYVANTEALEANVEAWKKANEQAARQEYLNSVREQYNDILKEQAENEIRLTEAKLRQKTADENAEEAKKRQIELYDKTKQAVIDWCDANNVLVESILMEQAVQDQMNRDGTAKEYNDLAIAVADYREEARRAAEDAVTLQAAIDDDAEAVAKAEEAMNLAEEAVRALTDAENENAQAAEDNAASYAEMETSVGGVIDQMQDLVAEYEAAYQAAFDSIDRQMRLFDNLEDAASASIDDMITSLDKQIEFMNSYAANIEKAMELGVDEGLIQKLSDGSEESAQILATIVEDGGENIDELNEKFRKVEEGKQDFADTVADMEAEFSKKMSELADDLNDAFSKMDIANETYIIGQNDVQGLINGTASKKQELVNKWVEMGKAALEAYKREVGQASPSKEFVKVGKYDVQGLEVGVENEKKNLETEYESLAAAALAAMERSLPSSIHEPSVIQLQQAQTHDLVAAMNGQSGGQNFNITVNAAPGQSAEEIAEVVMEHIQHELDKEKVALR